MTVPINQDKQYKHSDGETICLYKKNGSDRRGKLK